MALFTVPMLGQSSVSLKGDQGKDKKVEVQQGKEVEVEVKIDPIPNRDGDVHVVMNSSAPTQGSVSAEGRTTVLAGQTKATIKIIMPVDASLGEWRVTQTQYVLNGGSPYWRDLELKDKPTFTVVKGEGKEVIEPKSASVEIKEVK
jgi:hypothetical protein